MKGTRFRYFSGHQTPLYLGPFHVFTITRVS